MSEMMNEIKYGISSDKTANKDTKEAVLVLKNIEMIIAV